MADKTEAEKAAEARVNKAAWMNAQLDERLPDADYVQPGTAPAKDARPEGVYEAPKVKGDAKAAPKP